MRLRQPTVLLCLLLLAAGACLASDSILRSPESTGPVSWDELVSLAGGGLEWLLGLVISVLVADQGWRVLLRRAAVTVVRWVEDRARQGELAEKGEAKMAQARKLLRERYPWATKLVSERAVVGYLQRAVEKHAPPKTEEETS